MQPFILGLSPSIDGVPFRATSELYDLTGHNTGNLAFHYAIDRQLGGGLASVGWGAAEAAIDAAGPHAVLPCANQLGSHTDYGPLGRKFATLKVPITAIGLGAQSGSYDRQPEVSKGTLEWVRAIADHAAGTTPNISVRGPFSLRVLESFGLGDRAVILGCPTLFIHPDPWLGKRIAARTGAPGRIAVAAGHQRWTHLGRLEASLAQLVTETQGSYVGQSALEMLRLTRGEFGALDAQSRKDCRDYIQPQATLDEFARWSEVHGHAFFDVEAWLEHYRRFDFVLGTRIHGVILALQSGVPGLCIVHDTRMRELCETMLVPFVLAEDVRDGIRREDLAALYQFDADAFDRRRQELAARYVGFLHGNGLVPAAWLQAIADAGTTVPVPPSETP